MKRIILISLLCVMLVSTTSNYCMHENEKKPVYVKIDFCTGDDHAFCGHDVCTIISQYVREENYDSNIHWGDHRLLDLNRLPENRKIVTPERLFKLIEKPKKSHKCCPCDYGQEYVIASVIFCVISYFVFN